jgi:hypothetical protein
MELINDDLIDNNDSIDYIMTDLHIWKKNTDIIVQNINSIINDLRRRPEWIVNVILLWDLWENFSQTEMHSGQHINVEIQNPFDLQLYIADVLQKLLIWIREIWKKVSLTWITWNHDRVTSKNEDDLLRTAGLTIYEFVKRWLANTDITVNYFRENINQIILSWRNYILSHWEYWFNNKKPEDILWKYWKQDVFNIILSWHTHQHKQEIWHNYAKIVVSPLAWPWDYDERLWMKGEIWITTIRAWRVTINDQMNISER